MGRRRLWGTTRGLYKGEAILGEETEMKGGRAERSWQLALLLRGRKDKLARSKEVETLRRGARRRSGREEPVDVQ